MYIEKWVGKQRRKGGKEAEIICRLCNSKEGMGWVNKQDIRRAELVEKAVFAKWQILRNGSLLSLAFLHL